MPEHRRRGKSSDGWLIDTAAEFRDLPLWVGSVAAGASALLLGWIVPAVLEGTKAPPNTIALGPVFAVFVRVIGLVLAGAILLFSLLGSGERAIDHVVDLVRGTGRGKGSGNDGLSGSWREFERNLAIAYEPHGWEVHRRGGGRPDGGVDLELTRPGEKVLVQCKHWSRNQVGVKEVRELWGVVAHEGATRAVLATIGTFTPAATEFARDKSLDLMDGPAVRAFLNGRAVQLGPAPGPLTPQPDTARTCPACGRPMVLRTARRGPRVGDQFWGCSGFPDCRQVQPA